MTVNKFIGKLLNLKGLSVTSFDAFVKSQEFAFSVIPAKAGIQSFQLVTECLDSGFHRSDDFLRSHQLSIQNQR